MAQIVLGIGSSHTPMLNAPVEDWPRFIERDQRRPHRDKAGRPVSYEELLAQAGDTVLPQLSPDVIADKHRRAMSHVDHLSDVIDRAALDVLVIVGDDQKELYGDDNMPSILVYRGGTIPNVPARSGIAPEWAARASARFYETEGQRDYPVDTALADHAISHLIEAGFDVACADSVAKGEGEGHAFGFVHTRLLRRRLLPCLPIFLNTYYPPNQPTPARCFRLGQSLRAAIEAFPGQARVGIVASGGLSHFTVDESLDGTVIAALRARDAQALMNLPRPLLESGSSEIRNWICLAGAIEHLNLESIDYIPAYRTPAGTGTGLCFAVWRPMP